MPDTRQHGGGDRRGGYPPRGQPPAGEDGGPKERIRRLLASQDKVSGGYTHDGRLRPALLDREAQDAARAMERVPTTQVRRFYGQVLAIKRRIDAATGQVADTEVVAQIAFLKAAAAYGAARDQAKGEPLLRFLMPHANTIGGVTDFQHFHRHFETVVAFHRVYGDDKSGS